MNEFDMNFGFIVGIFMALAGVKMNFIKINTWSDIFTWIICMIIAIGILDILKKKIFKRK